MAYNTLVRPQVEYASCAWNPYVKHQINKIEMVQRRAARWCCNDYPPPPPYSSVSDMIDKLGWQTLQQRRSTSRLVMFYKIVYQLVAVDMPPCYSHPTRTSARHHSLHYYQIFLPRTFFPRTVVLWNSLPNSVVTMQDLGSFKSVVTKVPHFNP